MQNLEIKNYDIVVVGGGLSGICAAIQAARLGSSVALLEREIVLGGNSSSHFRLHLLGSGRYQKHGRETGIIEELEAEAAWKSCFMNVGHGDYLNDHWGEIIRYKCEQSGVHLFLKTVATEVNTSNNKIDSVKAFDMLNHRQVEFRAKYTYIDASGDGIIALLSGTEYRIGAEGQDEFDESFAPEKPDPDRKMASALLFMMRDTGSPVKYTPPPGTPVYQSEKDLPGGIGSWNSKEPVCVMWQTMYGGHLDTLYDDREIYNELLKIMHGTVDLLKNRGNYGAENYELFWISPFIGKREGRRFIGDYILSQKDMFETKRFVDAVAYGGRPVDVHEISEDKKHYTIHFYGKPDFYDIPLRCLYSKNIKNLYLAGRCISGTRIALGSYRVMKTLAAIGQAIGVAAYIGCKNNLMPRDVRVQKISEVQQILLREDATIIGIANDDNLDIAKSAVVRTSSETMESPAANIINGINRRLYDSPTNMWESKDMLPQWIELHIPNPAKINMVQLSWDTDLNATRGYRYSPYLEAFPETAADYTVSIYDGNKWHIIADIKDNYERFRRHRFEQIIAEKIRVEITRNQADGKKARLYEIRAYNTVY